MPVKKSDKIWMNGRMVNWDDAKVHILSHVIHYGSSVFEGIRVYDTPSGSAVFRLDEHVRRLLESAKIYRMDVPFGFKELREAMLETVQLNGLDECYIRPVIYRGYGEVGVNPAGCPIDVAIGHPDHSLRRRQGAAARCRRAISARSMICWATSWWAKASSMRPACPSAAPRL